MLTGLIVDAMVWNAESILDVQVDRPEIEDEILRTVEKQLRLVVIAAPHWRSAGGAPISAGGSGARRQ